MWTEYIDGQNVEVVGLDGLKVQSPFKDLFPIDPAILSAIKEDMKVRGFDSSKPIDVWMEVSIVIDGHTRLEAARQAGLTEVCIFKHSFPNEDVALAYAIHNQRDRRNFTDADIAQCVEAMDRRKERGGNHGNQYTRGSMAKAQSCAIAIDPEMGSDKPFDLTSSAPHLSGQGERVTTTKSAADTAKTLGVSPRKIEQTRTVLTHADEDTKQAVLRGDKSINRAYQETQERRRSGPKPVKEDEKKDPEDLAILLSAVANYGNLILAKSEENEIDRAARSILDAAIVYHAASIGMDATDLFALVPSPSKVDKDKVIHSEVSSREEPGESRPSISVIEGIGEERLQDKQVVMKRVKAMREEGLSYEAISNRLNEDGIPTMTGRGRWNIGTVYKQFMKFMADAGEIKRQRGKKKARKSKKTRKRRGEVEAVQGA